MEEIYNSPRNNDDELKVPQNDNYLYNPLNNISNYEFKKEVSNFIASENKKLDSNNLE